MNEFLGNITDTSLSKNGHGTWQFAKNILLTKGFKSISNEDGLLHQENFDGVLLGSIITNIDEVYFSLDGTTSEIGYINKRVQNPTYTVILRDDNLGFRLDCPIEGIYTYNYKGELIVVWGHGIRANAAKPMIFNITTPLFSITGGTIDNANDLDLIYLFPNINEGKYTLTRLEKGNLFGDIAYITYAYIYTDGSRTQFFPISNIAYITDGYLNTNSYGVHILLEDLDTKFTKIKLGLVLRDETTLKGYISYDISYTTSDTIEYDLISTDSFVATSADEIIIRPDSFSKIKTLTTTYDQIHIGNTVKDTPIDFQPYANMLTLEPVLEVSDDTNQHSFMPDEVMAFFIELQLLDGSYSDAFHIPGRVASGTETSFITPVQTLTYGFDWFSAATTKQFKMLNTGTVGGVLGAYTATWGYWENEELYPNDDNYNSTSLGGSDLRGTPIRHHRFPSLRALYDLDLTYLPARDGDSSENILTGNQSRFILNVKLTNFDTIVPNRIKSKIQGYRISYAKRTFANSLVIDNCAMIKRKENESVVITAPNSYKCVELLSTSTPEYIKSRLFSPVLFKYKPAIQPTFIIGNYFYNGIKMLASPDYTDTIPDANKFSEVSKITYAPANNLDYGNQYTEEGIDIDLVSSQDFGIVAAAPDQPGSTAINVTLIQLKDNLYSNLKSTDLIVVGRVDGFTNIEVLRNSDTSVKSFIDCSVYEILNGWSNRHRLTYIGYYSPLHTMALYNRKSSNIEITASNEPNLEGREYEFRVIKNFGASYLNDLNTIRTFDIVNIYINKFPYRVNSTNKISSEGNIMESIRTFPVNNYYDMPNNKGEIIALRGSSKILYIQQQFSLFITQVKDRLYTNTENIYLGTSELFSTIPDEVVRNDKGYIGCTSQFSCILFKGGYVTVDQIQGKIFLINDGKDEISAKGKRNYFSENWDIGFDISDNENGIEERVDNPFVSVGHIVGYDDKNNRLLFTKRHFVPKIVAGLTRSGQFYTFNGNLVDYTNSTYFTNKSKTWSYSLDNDVWVCEHDYIPNMMFHTSSGLYSVTNSFTGGKLYKHNNLLTKGLFYGVQYPSYIDLIFNDNLDISKLYESIMWVSDAINHVNNGDIYNETITHIALYNKSQCSGMINLKDNQFLLTRTVEGHWNFNAFRDLVADQFSPVIDENGGIITANINNNKLWFEMNNFISKFIVVRLYIDNLSQNTILIHSVNVQSIKSLR